MITRKELLTINKVPGREIKEVLGYVKGSTVQTKNVGKDILAGSAAIQSKTQVSRIMCIGVLIRPVFII